MRIFAAALALAAGSALAQEPGVYLGASFGGTSSSACDEITLGVSCKDGADNLRVFAGYQVNRNLALEAGYINTLLKSYAQGIPGSFLNPSQVSSELTARAVDLVLVPALPFGNASLYGKVGLFVASSKQTTTRAPSGGCCNRTPLTVTDEATDTGLTLGAGLEYRFGARFAVRGEWQRFQGVGGENVRDVDVNMLHAGLLYRF